MTQLPSHPTSLPGTDQGLDLGAWNPSLRRRSRAPPAPQRRPGRPLSGASGEEEGHGTAGVPCTESSSQGQSLQLNYGGASGLLQQEAP